ncbi:MAG TPA: dienelactone hydrolase family protein [Pyrinomonadaceae bacterium]|nr:dienelactone hydrolase family protein [Pyrinomonadaceae bacterium]
MIENGVQISINAGTLFGELIVPDQASGVVLFAHGSGSGRHSPRNKFVAEIIRKSGIGTLLFDLLTTDEEAIDAQTRHLRFDINLLSRRLIGATNWLLTNPETSNLNIGYFGASTGAGAALVAAGELGARIGAVVSRGGRPDLAGGALSHVVSPTLLIVGEYDKQVIELNEQALARLRHTKELHIVPGASHLFGEPGTLEKAAQLAADWFERFLSQRSGQRPLSNTKIKNSSSLRHLSDLF